MRPAIIISAVIAIAISCGGGTSEPSSLSNGPSSTSVSPTAVSMPDASLLVLTADDLGPTFSLARDQREGSALFVATYANDDRDAFTETFTVESFVKTDFYEEAGGELGLTFYDAALDDGDFVFLQVENGWDEILSIEGVDLGPLVVPYAAFLFEVRSNELLFTAYIVEMARGRVRAKLRVEASNEPGLGGVSLAQLTTNTRTFAERQAEKLVQLLPGE